jgi:hypothetical protein
MKIAPFEAGQVTDSNVAKAHQGFNRKKENFPSGNAYSRPSGRLNDEFLIPPQKPGQALPGIKMASLAPDYRLPFCRYQGQAPLQTIGQ